MEVMSSLLLCALVVLLPQGLGKQTFKSSKMDVKFNSSIKMKQKPNMPHELLINLNEPISSRTIGKQTIQSSNMDVEFNSSLMMNQKPYMPHKLLINLNEPISSRTIGLKNIYKEPDCEKCFKCMDRAIKAYSSRHRENAQELHYEISTNNIDHRSKRDADHSNATEFRPSKERKPKSKKNKVHKTVTVTKYNLDGVVTALKVKETSAPSLADNTTGKPSVATCEIFSVKKSFPCDSAEGDLVIKLAKRKNGKKGKREKEKDTTTTDQIKDMHPMYRKREVDNSQMPENVMSSVEDFY